MSTTKKILSIVLVLSLIGSLAACNKYRKYTSDVGRKSASNAADILEAYLDGTMDADTAKYRLEFEEGYLSKYIEENKDESTGRYEFFNDSYIASKITTAQYAITRMEPKSKIEEYMKELRKNAK